MPLELPRQPSSTALGARYLWSTLGGAALAVVLVVWRHFHWHHAFLVGLAGGALVWSTLRAIEQLRRLHQ